MIIRGISKRCFSASPKGELSHVTLGRRFEETCQRILSLIGISTKLVGGAGDGGIDLMGNWQLAPHLQSKEVIVQCKSISRPCPPQYIRELEGSLNRWPIDTIGILMASQPASKSTLNSIMISQLPLIFMMVEKERLNKVFVNNRLYKSMPKLIIGTRHESHGYEPVFFYSEKE